MPVEDVEMVRAVRRELARRHIDSAQTSVSCMRGVVHLYGRVRPLRGYEPEYEEELTSIYKVLKQRPGVRDVIMEWETGLQKLGSTSRVRSRE